MADPIVPPPSPIIVEVKGQIEVRVAQSSPWVVVVKV